MIRNYLKIAFRSLLRNKSYAFINAIGLAVGIAACLLLFLIVQFESSFDNFHTKKERIHQVVSEFHYGGISYGRGAPMPVPLALRTDYPQLEKVAGIAGTGAQINIYDAKTKSIEKKFKDEGGMFYAESEFFEIFDFPLLSGNPKTMLAEPYTAVLTQEMAEKLFGDWRSAIGKTFTRDNEKEPYRVTGVLKNIPKNTDFPLKVVLSYKNFLINNKGNADDWESVSGSWNCFILLPPQMSEKQFNALMPAFDKKHKTPEQRSRVRNFIRPLSESHYDSRFGNFAHHTISPEMIWVLEIIGAFLLLVACVNFINLATAQAVNRSKEVGVRKALGSNKAQLRGQFLGESALITVISVLLAILLAIIALPFLNTLLNYKLSLSFTDNPVLLLFLLIAAVVVIFLSGFYPAMVISGFNPILALKSKVTAKSIGGISLRRGLVVSQFVIAQFLIIATLVVVSQMNYFQTASMGFDKEAVIRVPVPNDSLDQVKFQSLKTQLQEQTGIKNVSIAFRLPADNNNWNSPFQYDHRPKDTDFSGFLNWADADYFKTFDLKFVAGKGYSPSDTVQGYVVNETMVKKLGAKSADEVLGKEINFWGGKMKAPIVGVIKDYHATSLHGAIPPLVIASNRNFFNTIGIKLEAKNMQSGLDAVEKIWTKFFPNYIYEYQFVDKNIENLYQQERQLSTLYQLFAGIAIFISCLGLYGLVSFMAVQRTKEVGIRKTLGASVGHIVYLFSKEFTILIGVAFLIAAPVGYYFMNDWLKQFEYKIDLGAGVFLMAIVGSIMIAWLTVSYQAIKAALVNPIKSLRSE
ncbi:ABC transporter permease [Emticicia sp. BO119]|uniref:ABC transporter permease n=1 Tax=Emticicia sp. BO119 TaxID=2757768 RepID=UPI0015F0EA93|nr:ABC transporter permease [Emticicia sp. BO119]MBA4850859.1 ABC transporter permease [Emticicia sp. BO119]